MKVVWSYRAQREFRMIKAYIAKRDQIAAADTQADIRSATRRLEQFPHSGPPTKTSGIRLLQVTGTVHAIPYRLGSDRIEILSVFDQRRDPEELF